MTIKEFKEKFLTESWSKEKDEYISKFGIESFRVYECKNLKLKEGYGYKGLIKVFYDNDKRISETQFKNRIKKL